MKHFEAMAAKKRTSQSFNFGPGLSSDNKTAKEDVCSFIKVTERQKELLKQAIGTATKATNSTMGDTSLTNTGRIPTGMSGMLSDRSGSSKEDEDKFDPVFIPDNFKKTRDEKMQDQGKVLQRLQGLMQDIRSKETK